MVCKICPPRALRPARRAAHAMPVAHVTAWCIRGAGPSSPLRGTMLQCSCKLVLLTRLREPFTWYRSFWDWSGVAHKQQRNSSEWGDSLIEFATAYRNLQSMLFMGEVNRGLDAQYLGARVNTGGLDKYRCFEHSARDGMRRGSRLQRGDAWTNRGAAYSDIVSRAPTVLNPQSHTSSVRSGAAHGVASVRCGRVSRAVRRDTSARCGPVGVTTCAPPRVRTSIILTQALIAPLASFLF